MKTRLLDDAETLPLIVEPAAEHEAGLEALCSWIVDERDALESTLLERGAVLLRGFDVRTPADFEHVCNAFERPLLNYAGGDSPRNVVAGRVYTSTEYPAHLQIPLHNEMSYRPNWPRRLFFFCQQPARRGGETPIADCRRILQTIDPAVVQRFAEKRVAYIQNLHGGWGFGKSWQETFETDDRDRVEAHCRANGIEYSWTELGLWTRSVCPAVIEHPLTGESAWFNQAALWHISSRGRAYSEKMLKTLGEEALPANATYGDGTPIENEALEEIRSAHCSTEVVDPWQRGDLLVLDNVLAAHGRKAFEGPRRVLVAMTA